MVSFLVKSVVIGKVNFYNVYFYVRVKVIWVIFVFVRRRGRDIDVGVGVGFILVVFVCLFYLGFICVGIRVV